MKTLVLLVIGLIATTGVTVAEMPWIRISDDGKGFENADTRTAFVPWGFNYDHDAQGRSIGEALTLQWLGLFQSLPMED